MGWLADQRRLKRLRHFTGEVLVALRRIETQRLILRWPQREDSAAFAATIDDELARINGWTPDHVRNMRSPVGVGTAPTNEPIVRMMQRLDARFTGRNLHTLPNGQLVDSNWYVFEREPASRVG